MSLPCFNGANFCLEGMGHFRPSGEPGSQFGMNAKLLHGSKSMPNDYVNTVFNDIGSQCVSFNLLQFSPCVLKFYPYKKGICYL